MYVDKLNYKEIKSYAEIENEIGFRVRDTEKNRVAIYHAIGEHDLDFTQDFFCGGQIFHCVHNYDDDFYDTDSEGFDSAYCSFDDYIAIDQTDLDDVWVANSKWVDLYQIV